MYKYKKRVKLFGAFIANLLSLHTTSLVNNYIKFPKIGIDV